MMKIPKVVLTPHMGQMITQFAAMQLCNYWAEESDWNGDGNVAAFWRNAALEFKRTDDMGVKGWVSSPTISAKLKEKGQPNFFWPYNRRHELERWI